LANSLRIVGYQEGSFTPSRQDSLIRCGHTQNCGRNARFARSPLHPEPLAKRSHRPLQSDLATLLGRADTVIE
jgi:hypothetical protein